MKLNDKLSTLLFLLLFYMNSALLLFQERTKNIHWKRKRRRKREVNEAIKTILVSEMIPERALVDWSFAAADLLIPSYAMIAKIVTWLLCSYVIGI